MNVPSPLSSSHFEETQAMRLSIGFEFRVGEAVSPSNEVIHEP